MAQVFRPYSNVVARAIGILLLPTVVGLIFIPYWLQAGPYYTYQTQIFEQPVPFSHEHHVGGLGIDCRVCHTSVEKGRWAGMPPTQTCMTCHSQLWTHADALAPVRKSWETGQPIAWNRVYNLPDYAYFNHSIHVNKGVGCSTCHGQIDKMPLTEKATPLTMSWCLDCHRHPWQYQRPADKIYDLHYTPPGGEKGMELSRAYGTVQRMKELTDCSMCHR